MGGDTLERDGADGSEGMGVIGPSCILEELSCLRVLWVWWSDLETEDISLDCGKELGGERECFRLDSGERVLLRLRRLSWDSCL